MRGDYAELLLVLGLLLCAGTTMGFGLNMRNSEVRCIVEERQALLKFKQGLIDYDDLLSSWGSHEEDCCKWKGIKCSNRTDHVVKLDLRGDFSIYSSTSLSGGISSSLLGLQHLTYLDLSNNFFSILPEFIGSLTKLQYLNLSSNTISGNIPQQFGNLTSLISLDLSWSNGLIEEHNLDWLFHLSSLRHLAMSGVNLSKVVNWPDKVTMLPSLSDLHLIDCELSMPIPHVLFKANSSPPLSFLDLSFNHLNSSIFPWLFKYANTLVVLVLSFNNFEGAIPQTLENLHNLQVLDLSNNNISGEIPDLSKLFFLREVHLSKNRLNGSLTKGIGKLSKLQVLDVSSNSFGGDITEAHLSNLSSLNHLDLSFNFVSLKFSPNWIPPFHLDAIILSSCKLGPAFPQWLQTQENFSLLEMFDVGISDTIPNWFWDLSFNIQYLNLSHNQITSTIPLQWFSSRFFARHTIDLSYNQFSGPLPQLNSNWIVLNLSNNLFQGLITSICETKRSMRYRSYLDLSNNLLSGELPNCWRNVSYLAVLSLANNNFYGRIPDSLGSICKSSNGLFELVTLHLQNNSFIGEFPKSLMNCYFLKLLDLGENKLFGRIPKWIGTSLPKLLVLRLKSNLFIGRIPLQLCHLASLQILDLSYNGIAGTIPNCLNNLSVMSQIRSSDLSIAHPYLSYNIEISSSFPSYYIENLPVTLKGKIIDYSKTLGLVKLIDLSSNKLKGEIPREITSLTGLIELNLSRNLLTGIIPHSIGEMERLKSLDLSRNHILGIIPPSLATLSFLNNLNLSNNNLSGRIPSGTQLQSFNASAYASNRDLCSLPLPKMCLGDEAAQNPQTGSKHGEGNIAEHTNSHEHLWFYTSIALGFIVGFWGVCGSLLLKSSWRHAYFRYLERIGDWLYVTIAVRKAKLLRNFKTQC